MCIGIQFTSWHRPSRKLGPDCEKVREALSKIKYDSAVGEVTFDDHNQARLPMILLQIEGGKPSVKGAYKAEIQYPAR